MRKMNKFARYIVQFFSITLITLVVLELGFQVTHFVLFKTQHNSTQQIFKTNEIRILCIGESITAGVPENAPNSYPRILEKKLKEQYPKFNFRVINRGMAGVRTSFILKSLPEWLEKDKPQIVISMLGLGDRFFTNEIFSLNFSPFWTEIFQKSRVFRFFNLASNLFLRKFEHSLETPVWETKLEDDIVYRDLFMKASVAFNEGNFDSSLLLFQQFVSEMQQRRTLGPFVSRSHRYFLKIPESLIDHYYGALRSILLIHERKKTLKLAEATILNAVKLDPESPFLHFMVSRFYFDIKNNVFGKQYQESANKLMDRYVLKSGQENYRLINRIIQEKGIIHVAMQYPLRPLEYLKVMLENDDRTYYVDNKKSFVNLVTEQTYYTYFTDNCGGMYGHGTTLANTLIVQNIIDQFFDVFLSQTY